MMKTSRPRTSNSQGFTLIEVMIVTAILAGMALLMLSRFNKTNNDIKSAIRKITVLSKEVHNAARMNNRTYRIVFTLDEKEGSSVWVESGPKTISITESSFYESPDEKDEEKDEEAPPKPFQPDGSILKKPITLPKPLGIRTVEITGQKDSITNGKAFLYYFPQGLTQESAIHIGDKEKLNWTIAINPITGEARVVSEDKSLKELRTE